MWRYVFNLSPTEIWMFSLLALAGTALFVFSLVRRKPPKTQTQETNLYTNPKSQPKGKEPKKKELNVTEIFDYNGVKILHEKGTYFVNDQGILAQHSSWEALPKRYQMMILELDQRSQGNRGEDYFLEMLNGYYYISEPNGKKKRYDSIADIPPRIRRIVGLG